MIPTRQLAEGVAWFEFASLCETPRSSADFLSIARRYHTVLLSNIPTLSDEQIDRVLRFVHLVDALYEHQVNFIVSAADRPTSLYLGNRIEDRFQRTRSRLMEMQSHEYLAREHIARAGSFGAADDTADVGVESNLS